MNWSPFQRAVLAFVVVVCVVSIAVAAWGVAKWGFSRAGADVPDRGITVNDSAEVRAKPDVAYVTLGVVTKARDAGSAAKANASKTDAVIAAIVKLGIPKSGIKTVDYSLDPEMDYDKDPSPIVGYTATNSISVKLTELDRIGTLVDTAVAAGANTVRSVSFDVQDKRKLREEALAEAVKKAESKARAIAGALGVRLGSAVSASEDVSFYGSAGMNYAPLYRARHVVASVAKTPLEPGLTKVSAQVEVVYAVR